MRILCCFILILLEFICASDWGQVHYFYKSLEGNKNIQYVEKTYKGVTYNSYTVIRDDHGRRAVKQNRQAKQHALFLGCSLVFGDGVENKETLPELFQNLLPEYQVYNYGYCGEGPNDVLYRLQNRNIAQEVAQFKGICFFFYPVGWHESRVRLHSGEFCSDAPFYGYKNGRLEYLGSMKNVQWLMYRLIVLYNKLPIPEKYRQPFPKHQTMMHYELIADILLEVGEEYKRQFGSEQFYVVIHPFSLNDRLAIKTLQAKGLRVIVLERLEYLRKNIDQYTIAPWDGHSNAKMHKVFARALADKLRALVY